MTAREEYVDDLPREIQVLARLLPLAYDGTIGAGGYYRGGSRCCNKQGNQGRYACTLPADHVGPHIATDVEPGRNFRIWNG